MKKTILTITLLFAFVLSGLAQSFNLPLKFNVNESAVVSLGNHFDGTFQDTGGTINMQFDGNTFTIYTNGKVYSNTKVISFQKKEKKGYDNKPEMITYSLKIAKKGFIQYVIIKKEFQNDFGIITVKIPYLSPVGETNGYNYYRILKPL